MSNTFNPKWTYCSNAFPLTSPEAWTKNISFFGEHLQKQLQKTALDLGLWISASILDYTLQTPSYFREIQNILERKNLNCFTMNSFPYGNFHQKIVKTEVYKPDWSTTERLKYTLNCATFLTTITNYKKTTISTLPLGWAPFWNKNKTEIALENLYLLVVFLEKLEEKTNKQVQVCLEPEPGCVLEYTSQTIFFWTKQLIPFFKKKGYSTDTVLRYLGICYDTCHQSVQFENVTESLKSLSQHQIPIGKIQISCALEFLPDEKRESLSTRQTFTEEKFLHQTRIQQKDSSIVHYDDLDLALKNSSLSWNLPWRTHYHLPLFLQDYLSQNNNSKSFFKTTIQDTIEAILYALNFKLCEHFEIETYTWNILPQKWRPTSHQDLIQNISKEWLWLQNQIQKT